MNHIPATITEIKTYERVTIISLLASKQPMQMMALEIDDSLGAGSEVILGAKASNITLAKAPLGLMSISNQLDSVIESIENGKLLSSVKFYLGETLLESIITFDSSKRMNLKKGDSIIALIKSSELSILRRI